MLHLCDVDLAGAGKGMADWHDENELVLVQRPHHDSRVAKLGMILTGEDGKTVYKFTADSAGKSTCSGGCADNWPPFALEGNETVKAGAGVTGKLGTITRDDGKKQVTYNDVPLYYFAGDSKAGDTNGQGVGGKWFVVNP